MRPTFPFTTTFPSFTHPILPLLLNPRPTPTLPLPALHAYAITSGLLRHPFLASRVVDLSLRAGPSNTRTAATIFDSIHQPDVYTWNSMIAAHAGASSPDLPSLRYYFRMRVAGAPPNGLTFALLVKACVAGRCGVGVGRMVHGQAVRCGADEVVVVRNSLMGMYCGVGLFGDARLMFDTSPHLDVVSYNIMISAYGKNGDVDTARELFAAMPNRSLVSWSAMIDGYVRSGEYSEALSLFGEMQAEGVRPDVVVLVSLLKACAHLGALDHGRWVHMFIGRSEMGKGVNVVLATALIDMYCKCGCIDAALDVFNSTVQDGDVVLWNAMIGGLAMHGHAKDALDVFWRMRDCGIAPSETTFIGALCACSHAGMVREGIELFESMKKDHGLYPWREHYGCLADLLGRAGLVKEAEVLLSNMPVEPQASQWGALMSACVMQNNIEVGERVGKHLISLEPEDGGRYVSLSNIYIVAGRRKEARAMRKAMEARGAWKETGCSFIECNGVVHEFIAGDTTHAKSADVYKTLEDIESNLEMAGNSL